MRQRQIVDLADRLGMRLASQLAPEAAPIAAGIPPERATLPVADDLASLLPGGVLAGSVGLAFDRIGATSLLFRLLAGPTSAGRWCAIAGLDRLWPLAAQTAGVNLKRLALIEVDGPDLIDAIGALAAGIPVVAAPSTTIPARVARRLEARARRSGTALVWLETARPVTGVDARLEIADATWHGLRPNCDRLWGPGRLSAIELDVTSTWRGGTRRQATVWPYGRHSGPEPRLPEPGRSSSSGGAVRRLRPLPSRP